jgi:hypothetical protein
MGSSHSWCALEWSQGLCHTLLVREHESVAFSTIGWLASSANVTDGKAAVASGTVAFIRTRVLAVSSLRNAYAVPQARYAAPLTVAALAS